MVRNQRDRQEPEGVANGVGGADGDGGLAGTNCPALTRETAAVRVRKRGGGGRGGHLVEEIARVGVGERLLRVDDVVEVRVHQLGDDVDVLPLVLPSDGPDGGALNATRGWPGAKASSMAVTAKGVAQHDSRQERGSRKVQRAGEGRADAPRLVAGRREDVNEGEHVGVAEVAEHLDLAQQPLAVRVYLERARDLFYRDALSALDVAARAH